MALPAADTPPSIALPRESLAPFMPLFMPAEALLWFELTFDWLSVTVPLTPLPILPFSALQPTNKTAMQLTAMITESIFFIFTLPEIMDCLSAQYYSFPFSAESCIYF